MSNLTPANLSLSDEKFNPLNEGSLSDILFNNAILFC